MNRTSAAARAAPDLRRGLRVSAAIAGLAALGALAGGLAAAWFVGVGGALLNGVGALLALLTVRGRDFRLHGARCLLYLALTALCVPLTTARKATAEANARPLVAALEAYHVAHGVYPKVLEQLLPDQLEAIPLAFDAPLVSGEFRYIHTRDSYFLAYRPIGVTPFVYDPAEGAWRMRD